jgi:hypothetical protein
VIHERMNEADNRESGAGSVRHWGPATISVPAEDPAGEVEAAHGIRARGQLHAAPLAYGRYLFRLLYRARPAA